MRAGPAVAIGYVLAIAVASPACADAIISVVNNAKSGATVRVDGAFGCRTESRATAPTDMEVQDRCTFGATLGNHLLEIQFDDGKKTSMPVAVPQSGYALTLTGAE
jgi:hypothetical protein